LGGVVGFIIISVSLLFGGAIAARQKKHFTAQSIDPISQQIERETSDKRESLILEFDEKLEKATEAKETTLRDDIKEQLRSVAIKTIAVTQHESSDQCRDKVLTGTWTDDTVVAAFLGNSDAPDTPVRWRLYAWLYDDKAFQEAVERTIVAIEEYQNGNNDQ
jgi:hypothetical protein